MNGRQFDSFARMMAERATRRTFIARSAVVAGSVGALTRIDSASAARRGANGITSICKPDGAGGYYRDTVATINLQNALNAGAIVSDCCAHAECGESSECAEAYCDFSAGACATNYLDGYSCERPGCVDGVCSGGACADPNPHYCPGDGVCNICSYDACLHQCSCWVRPCYTDDYQCMDAYCSAEAGGCLTEPINERSTCDTNGVNGTCNLGYCTAEE